MAMSEPHSNIDQLAAVLGRVPSGLSILTVCNALGDSTGMLASWVQQASFAPPCVTVAVNRKRYLNDWLRETGQLALSLVGDGQKQFLGHFGNGFEPDEDAFAGLTTALASNGCPVLLDALGWLAGEVIGKVEVGDHFVYAVEIREGGHSPSLDQMRPWVHIRKNGLNY
jgi:flavin reductase (DIM6/NTAB) family NADH-FMN oxidoreductase RutF